MTASTPQPERRCYCPSGIDYAPHAAACPLHDPATCPEARHGHPPTPPEPPTAAQEACPVCGHAIDAVHKTPSMAHGPCTFTDGLARCVFGPMHGIGYHHLTDGRNVAAPPADAPEQQDDERALIWRALTTALTDYSTGKAGLGVDLFDFYTDRVVAALASRRPATPNRSEEPA